VKCVDSELGIDKLVNRSHVSNKDQVQEDDPQGVLQSQASA